MPHGDSTDMRDGDRPDGPSLTYVILRAALALRALTAAQLEEFALSHTSYIALLELARQPNLTASDLAARCGVRRQTMNDMVRTLLSMRVIERAPAFGDRRAYVLRVTPFGRRFLRHAGDALRPVELEATSALSEPELRDLVERLRILARRLDRVRWEHDDGWWDRPQPLGKVTRLARLSSSSWI